MINDSIVLKFEVLLSTSQILYYEKKENTVKINDFCLLHNHFQPLQDMISELLVV